MATSISMDRMAVRESAADVRVPVHDRVVLDNGLTLIVMPRRDVPLVSFNVIVGGGELAAAGSRTGVPSLVAGLLEKGSGSRDAFAFADAVEGVGGSFGAHASAESISLRGTFLARDQKLMVELLAGALLHPHFEPDELDHLRERHIELIKAAKDSDPSELIGTYGRAFVFRQHPYGRAVVGSESSLAAITQEEILSFYHSQVGADRATIVFVGDVDSVWLKREVARVFGTWGRAERPMPVPAPAKSVRGRPVLLIDSPGSVQTHFWLGNVGVDRHYPARAALDLVNTLYGGRFTSLLNTELRIKSGLSYGARSGFSRGSVSGEFSIRSFAQTENTGKAIGLALQTLTRLKREGVSEEMLDSSRAYVLGQYPLNFETAADWAGAMGELELFRLGTDYIDGYGPALRAVTLDDCRAVIDDAFPTEDALAIVLIGDAARIRDQVSHYGPISDMALVQPTFEPPGT